MPHNSHKTTLPSNWLILFLSKFQYGKNEGDALEGDERRERGMMLWAQWQARLEVKTKAEVHPEAQEPPAPVYSPSLAPETPPELEEIMKRIVEANQLKQVGRLPQLLLMQQLAQMAAETRPSRLGWEELG